MVSLQPTLVSVQVLIGQSSAYSCLCAGIQAVEPDRQPGLVKLMVDGLQSSVCSQQWDNNDASVYCRTLGYNFGRAFGTSYQYSTLPRIVSNVTCSGNEATIAGCPFTSGPVTRCDYHQNAKVFCYTNQQGELDVETALEVRK